ncbi:MAG TPA: Zn-dependent hydrolase [Desulfotomaculum sp.]|nr:Zn-dependent hydrolase [Desulfotomaculum sp.]
MDINLSRMLERFNTLARFGATERGGLSRLALSDADKEARDQFVSWLIEAGLAVRVDDAGNIYGRREGTNSVAPAVLMGSHLDTVYKGGRFDGVIGVLGAFEVVETLNDYGVQTRAPLELVVFTNEEGARFQPALLGSGLITGYFTRDFVYSRRDQDGKTFGEELERIGYKGKEENRPGPLEAYLELHVEQGPVLEAEGLSVGVVEGIQGMVWLKVTIWGDADHAGPTPMEMRRDSMVAAARIISRVRELSYQLGKGTVTTVGHLCLEPNIVNVIPGKTVFTIDMRNPRDEIIEQGISAVKEIIARICENEKVSYMIDELWRVGATSFDLRVVQTVEDSVRERGYSYKRMISGAGHDAQYMARVTPVGMIFVPSIGGKSHTEEEAAPWDDIERGVNVLLTSALKLAGID